MHHLHLTQYSRPHRFLMPSKASAAMPGPVRMAYRSEETNVKALLFSSMGDNVALKLYANNSTCYIFTIFENVTNVTFSVYCPIPK